MIERRQPLKRKTSLKRGSSVRKMSPKRQKESRIYSKRRIPFLEKHPICQIWLIENEWFEIVYTLNGAWTETLFVQTHDEANKCTACSLVLYQRAQYSSEVHHKSKRTGKNYLDESTWLAVCRENHERIHREPKWARERGYLV